MTTAYLPLGAVVVAAAKAAFADGAGMIVLPAAVVPPIEPPVEPPPGMMVGTPAGAGRGRMIRRRERKREEAEELGIEERALHPVDLPPPAPGPKPPDLKPPPPGLMAGISIPIAQLPPTLPLDEDEEEIALLLELLS